MNTKRIESEHHDVAVEAIPYTQTSATVNPSHNPNNPNNPQELEVDLNESPSDFLDMIRHVVDDMTRRVNENVTDQYNAADLTNSEIQANFFSTFANAYYSNYHSSRRLDLLEQAITCQRQALSLVAEGQKMKPRLLNSLGGLLYDRFERLGKVADVNEAIECCRRAFWLAPEGHTGIPDYLNNVGLLQWARFRQFGEQADLDQAFEYQIQAVQLADDNHPSKPAFLNNLGNSFVCRYKLLGNPSDLNQGITFQTQALQLAPEDSADKPALLNNLGSSIFDRYERHGDLADLDKAIDYRSQVVRLTSKEHASSPIYLSNLGNLVLRRFERLGNLVDVDIAIDYQEKAVQLTPEGDVQRPGFLDSLGCARLRRFERTGDLEDVDQAIAHQMQAVQLTPVGHPSRGGYLNNLGHSWRLRSERLKDLTDVDNAIQCHEQAVQLTPKGHNDEPALLMNLGCSWWNRFQQLHRLADLNKAIEYQDRAVQITPDGHTNKQLYLNSLGISLRDRSEILNEPVDLDKAIKYQVQAVHLTLEGHSDRSGNLNNLADSFASRYRRFGHLADLNEAVDYRAQAVQLTPEGHGMKAGLLLSLGYLLMSRFECLDQRVDLESAQAYFQHGAEHIITHPEKQIQCAHNWAVCSTRLEVSPLEACQRLFALIPYHAWVGMTIQGRYRALTDISDLTAQSIAWAVSVEHYDLAIEWLEEGRSIVWNQILQLRTPFDSLADVDPGLANHLKVVASELEGAGSRTVTTASNTSTGSQPDLEHQAQHHRHLAAQWETLLAEARQLPGFQDFLRPRKARDLKKAAMNGPIVIINTHPSHCDALIIFPGHDDVAHVPLDRFSEAKAVECRAQMISLIGHRGDGDKARGVKLCSKNTDSKDQLLPLVTLWTDVVGPVLDALAISRERHFHELPHITWCATGALSFLPLHAAGLYDGIAPNAFDLVISSYTPTLSALLYHGTCGVGSHTGVLTVGQAHSPGMSPLPKTVGELAIIKKHAGKMPLQQLDGPLATVDAILRAMEDHSWVHLACHAVQNRADPSQSAFHLHDGKLTLAAITKRAFKNKGLAFLSACQTATGDDTLPDEATHLAAGMLMAGYPSVIATMWSIMDDDAPEIAEVVYAELMQDGKMDYTNAAGALHKAVGRLREKVGPKSIGRWAPFIHMGV